MYNTKIFNSIKELYKFLIDNNIIDYSFIKYNFEGKLYKSLILYFNIIKMIDIKNYDFYNFNLKDFENDGYIFNKYEYCFFKKENDKIIIGYTNYDKNRILELFVFDKLKDGININFYDFYKVITIDGKSKIEKELKHIEKAIKIKENYNLGYNCFGKIFKKYIGYEYTIDKLFNIENTSLYNDNYIDILNILFDKYFIQKAIEYIN